MAFSGTSQMRARLKKPSKLLLNRLTGFGPITLASSLGSGPFVSATRDKVADRNGTRRYDERRVSIRGIFNTTVSGKWVVPARINVPLEDHRDLEDRLTNARRRPVLVYDRTKDCGWLVPEFSLVVHMALTYLN
ncbi:hypothetical protein TSTA_048240 [Talaromyces stipitatus ATCC 10500]|uniref:Uncharacterized protein n=1 Tax=Talaromyces stipitatus (strain ATCC 10500 / CBS 375.48 / QM 6759 / NRRL 1006) TaxID=441959 RepID=B8MKM6_TALSN|nr:uncharacterized protein TSTA_048240 [Talaromyces stipitatus ATCC 10500]EED15381.1 hypothetical protein TSTA_048240 [Talaromyces stipitatus ATCC 10500]